MMRIWEILQISFDALVRHKMRSFLTMLGIIIGVGAVISMVAIGEGAQSSVNAQINSLGTNVLLLFPGGMSRGGVASGAGSATTLTEEDGQAIREECPAVAFISPMMRTGGQVVFRNANWGTSIQGGSPDLFTIRDWRIEEGEFFTSQDVRAATKVCLLGQTVVRQIFPNEKPIGQTVRIRSIPFMVVGTLKSKGQNMMGQDQDDIVLVPHTTLEKRLLGHTHAWGYIISAVSKEKIADAQQQITDVLRLRHKLAPGEDNDFTIRTQTEIAEASNATTETMTVLLFGVAFVSLLVGGIGIMNIMLVSVTERTREIGIRMSIGARRRDILIQFLMESIVLSLLGGCIGIGLGILISSLFATVAGWPTLISTASIFLAVLFSMAVGITFGYYPAHKASSLNPIEALRYE